MREVNIFSHSLAAFGEFVFVRQMNCKQCSLSAFAAAAVPSAPPSAPCGDADTAAALLGSQLCSKVWWAKTRPKAAPFRANPAV